MRDSIRDFQGNAKLIRSSYERLFESLMKQSADRIYIKDTAGRFVIVSDALARTHGMHDRNELESMSDFDFFTREIADAFYAEEQEILQTGKPVVNRIEKEVWKDGKTTWASVSKVPLQLESGVTIGILGISRDVSEEHRAKERLEEQNEKMLADYASAEEVQGLMIPGRIPHVDGIDLTYVWEPMDAVGGDIINFPKTPGGELLFFLGDVCGHGVQAAFYTILLKYITARTAETYQANPDEFLEKVGSIMADRMGGGFVAAIAGHFGPSADDGSRDLFLSNTGNPDYLIYRAANHTVEHGKLASAIVMGLIESKASQTERLRLFRGDRFIIFSDGIIETVNELGEEFGINGLKNGLLRGTHSTLQVCLNELFTESISRLDTPGQQDDISLIAFELKK